MKRAIAITLIALGIAVVALAAFSAPPPLREHHAPIAREERAANAALLVGLEALGFERAWVDAREAEVLVVFEPPSGVSETDAARVALSAAAHVAPEAWLTARSTEGRAWSVAASDVRLFWNGDIERADLEARIVQASGPPAP